MLSMHKLLARSPGRESLLSNLDLPQADRTELVKARSEIRAALRIAISQASKAQNDNGKPVAPKFFTQGSWAYETLNNPSHLPPQQVDMDDGCYLPINFVKETGKPKQAANGFFAIADNALRALCQMQGWKYVDDNENCCRVELNSKMHVDVPLYAIDEERFLKLSLTEAKTLNFAEAERADDSADLEWARAPEGEVLHATRSGSWQSSDPMAVRDWAHEVVNITGEQLRSIWRYLKTWRDLNFKQGGPSSILLMAIVERGFGSESLRDDVKLRDVADYLANEILNDIHPPWDENENLNRLSPEERQNVARLAGDLVTMLNDCFKSDVSKKVEVLKKLRSSLSAHVPDKPDAIEETGPYAVALALAPTRTEIAPWSPNTKSG
jgi:hypothetical protein